VLATLPCMPPILPSSTGTQVGLDPKIGHFS